MAVFCKTKTSFLALRLLRLWLLATLANTVAQAQPPGQCFEGFIMLRRLDACDVCNGDSDTCLDCAGVPNGPAVYDRCDVCGGDNSVCLDCAGVPNGAAVVDFCGVCGGDGSSCPELDCARVPNGPNVYDACDVCAGDGSTCRDCLGVLNGPNVYDECDVCAGDGASCRDCAGVLLGAATYDRCDVCGGDGSSCLDCFGVPNGYGPPAHGPHCDAYRAYKAFGALAAVCDADTEAVACGGGTCCPSGATCINDSTCCFREGSIGTCQLNDVSSDQYCATMDEECCDTRDTLSSSNGRCQRPQQMCCHLIGDDLDDLSGARLGPICEDVNSVAQSKLSGSSRICVLKSSTAISSTVIPSSTNVAATETSSFPSSSSPSSSSSSTLSTAAQFTTNKVTSTTESAETTALERESTIESNIPTSDEPQMVVESEAAEEEASVSFFVSGSSSTFLFGQVCVLFVASIWFAL